ncbi:hypothetical protein [Salinibius halmophilus]|uniref:hypothetical protein n=1 Tax=Salinibius halmophilus TaxID=1853216 RepID=UPI000E674FA1|nr:hypothetical protein [Salinibius halmophilus]
MAQVYWIIGGILVVALCVFALMASQSSARNRKLRSERIQRLNQHNRQLRSLLRVMPSGMISQKLVDFIVDNLKANTSEIIENRPDNPVLYQTELAELESGNINIGGDSSGELRSIEQVNVLRSALAALGKEIQAQHKSAKLDKKQAQSLIDEVDIQLAIVAGSFLERAGLANEKQKKYREAIAAWQKAIDNYANSRMKNHFTDEALKLRGYIKRAQQSWRDDKQQKIDERDAARAAEEEAKGQSPADESWQKPNLYD